jgi:hypothetical protein
MQIRINKVRRTDYRPPSAPAKPALEASRLTSGGSVPTSGLDHWSRIERETQAAHDRAVAGYSLETMQAALQDLWPRNAKANDPESRWIRHRRAALARRLA